MPTAHDTITLKHTHSTEIDYLVFTASNTLFALPYYILIKIVDCPQCTSLPNMPSYMRGVVELMGKPVILLDMRKIIGNNSLAEEIDELTATIATRKQDHLNWINKLKDSVYNVKEITVETNPHKCAFGRWYDTFKTESINLKNFMKRFDTPHKSIHNLAVEVKKLIEQGQRGNAEELILHAENNELRLLIGLFDTFEETVRSFTYEYAIMINNGKQQFALAVDGISSFGKFDEVIPKLPASMRVPADHLVETIGRKVLEDRLEDILIINCDNLTL